MSGQETWFVAAVAVTAFVGTLAFFVRRLLAGQSDAVSANARVAADYYKPMARLLAEDEFERLTSLGLTRRQVEHLRASRRRVFRQYLEGLQGDFRALHREARMLLRDSTEDRPDLAAELVKQYAVFQYSVALAHGRLAAHSLGLQPVDTKGLLESVRWMHQQVELLRTPALSAS